MLSTTDTIACYLVKGQTTGDNWLTIGTIKEGRSLKLDEDCSKFMPAKTRMRKWALEHCKSLRVCPAMRSTVFESRGVTLKIEKVFQC